jgi:hypothetical protein
MTKKRVGAETFGMVENLSPIARRLSPAQKLVESGVGSSLERYAGVDVLERLAKRSRGRRDLVLAEETGDILTRCRIAE